jgi:plasmid maintenance system killer protein
MIDFNNRQLFTPFTHPESGVRFHILTRKVAPVQQGFYFVNDSMSADGRYLWFYCAFPPSLVKTLGVVDFQTGEVRHFPETQFSGGASPHVDPPSGDVFWGVGPSLWRRGPQTADTPQCVNSLPADLIGAREVSRLATHLTRSANGLEFFIDAQIGLQHVLGSLPVDGGDFQLWHRFDRTYNHAQFSSTDPDEALFAQEIHSDPITGLTIPITNRLWVIRRGGKPRPILREPKWVSHEWWDADGKHVWCVWGNETWRVRVADGEVEKIAFPRQCWHSHSSRDGRLIVGDSNNGFFRGCASTVHFMNRDTGKVIVLAEHAECTDYAGRHYHIDPHPRFCCNDQYVVFTTTVRGEIDVAIVPTEDLVKHTY